LTRQPSYSQRGTTPQVTPQRRRTHEENVPADRRGARCLGRCRHDRRCDVFGNAGRNGGEYYTPRPLIRAIIQVTRPRIGDRIYDGAVGSAGFLCESFEYLKHTNPKRTTAQDRTLQERTFYGKEKKSLAYVIAIMNMILHGIEAPNILHTNTLTENLADIQEKDRFDVVLGKGAKRLGRAG